MRLFLSKGIAMHRGRISVEPVAELDVRAEYIAKTNDDPADV